MMKQAVTRGLSILLAILTLGLTACSSGEDGSEKTDLQKNTEKAETTEAVPEYPPLPEMNMDGFEMRYLNYDSTWLSWTIHNLVADEMTGDALNDEVYYRNARIAEKYNCSFSETLLPYVHEQLGGLVQSGDAGAEVTMLSDARVVSHYINGNLQIWNVLPYLDFEADYWNQDCVDCFSIMGNVFAMTGDFSLGMSSRSYVLMMNKDMYADLGMDLDLYQLARDGKWTLDTFLELENAAVQDVNGDGKMDAEDRFGSTGEIKLYFGGLVTAAGVKYIEKDEEGLPYFAIPGNAYAMEVLSALVTKHAGTNAFYRGSTDIHSDEVGGSMYRNGQLLFKGTSLKSITKYRDAEFDFGLLPFPKYTEDQDRYYSLTAGGTMATLPKTLNPEVYEYVGVLLEELGRDSHENLIPMYKEVLLKSRYARDPGSSDMLDIVLRAATYDIGFNTLGAEVWYAYMQPYLVGDDTFASLTQKLSSTIDKKLEEMREVEE